MKNNMSVGKFVFVSSIIFAIVALCSVVLADTETILPGGSIRVSMISQVPDPVAPGEYAELRWMVTNLGSKPLEDVEFRLVPDYPFELLGTDGGIKGLGTIQGHQKGEEGIVLYYRVRINEGAAEGVNKLTLMYRFKGMEDWSKLDYFSIRVRNLYAAVIIDSFDMVPSVVAPGSVGKLNIKLTNMAESTMKDVDLKLDLTLSSIPRSATGAESSLLFDALPFTPIGSSGEKRLGQLKPGKSATFSFDLMVYPAAASKVYKVPLMLSYNDGQGNLSAKSDLVSIVVGASPDIYAVIDKSDLVAGKKSGIISFKFVNRGVTDIKFLDVQLKDTADFDVVSSKEEYVGNVNSDDYESVDFSLYLKNNVDKKKSSTISFPLHITFKDANNVDYAKDANLEYKIYTAEEKGAVQSSSLAIIIAVIVVMIIVWIVYRRWEKRRKEKKAQ
jgi:hypothetical protein